MYKLEEVKDILFAVSCQNKEEAEKVIYQFYKNGWCWASAKNFDEVRFKKGVHFPYKNGTSYYMNFNGSLLCVPNDSHNIKEYEIIKALDIIKNPEILEEKIKKVEILMLDKL